MSIRIATLSFGTARGASLAFFRRVPVLGLGAGTFDSSPILLTDDDAGPLLNTLLLPPSLLLGAAGLGRPPPPRVPRPISTATFPDRTRPPPPRVNKQARVCRRYRRRGKVVTQSVLRKRLRNEESCAICLETVTPVFGATLPCHHTFHRLCLFSVLTAPALGSNSMLRCPLCRASVDRHDLAAMGCDVSPSRLVIADRRCNALGQLAAGGYNSHAVAHRLPFGQTEPGSNVGAAMW